MENFKDFPFQFKNKLVLWALKVLKRSSWYWGRREIIYCTTFYMCYISVFITYRWRHGQGTGLPCGEHHFYTIQLSHYEEWTDIQ